MQEKINWFLLQLKALTKGAGIYVSIVCLAGLLILINLIAVPDGKNMRAGVLSLHSLMGDKVIDNLGQKESVFEFIGYESRDELVADVKSGQIECAFVFDEKFDRNFAGGRLKKSVEYLCSPDTTKGEVVCETVYTAIFKEYSEVILQDGDYKLYGDEPDEGRDERIEMLYEKNKQFYEGDSLFSTNFVRVKTATMEEEKKTDILRGMAAFMVFLFMYLSYGKRWSGNDNYRLVLNAKNRLTYDITGGLAVGFVLVFACLIILAGMGKLDGAMDVVNMIAMAIYSAIWISIVCAFMKTKEAFYANMIAISLFFVILSPIFVDLADYLPAIKYIRILIPINLFL